MLADYWDRDQIRLFVRQLKQEAGGAWDTFLTPRLKLALVADAAFRVVRSQSQVVVPIQEMNALLYAMEQEAGLRDENGELIW